MFKHILTAAIIALGLVSYDTLSDAQAGIPDPRPLGEVQNGFEYKAIAASQTDSVLGATGAAGDYLDSLIVTVNTAATAAVSIKDGSGSSITLMPNSPGGGIGVYTIPIKLRSLAGAWKVTTGAGSTVVAVGRFTD